MYANLKSNMTTIGAVLALTATGLVGCSNSSTDAAQQGAAAVTQAVAYEYERKDMFAPYTSDPFSMLQRFGPPKLTAPAQAYWDVFTPDLDPAIQCLPANIARELFGPAGILLQQLDDGHIKMSLETIYMDGRDFPDEYSLANRGNWPQSDMGYSIGEWDGNILKVETRGMVERDILIGHIPILPSDQVIITRAFKMVAVDQRWEALGLAPQEVNAHMVPDATAKTLEMDVWLDDPETLLEQWHTVKQYREVTSSAYVASGGDLPVTDEGGVDWEGTDAAANSGVPEEFLANYDGGCVLFPEYDETGASDIESYIPK